MVSKGEYALVEANWRVADCVKSGRDHIAGDWPRIVDAIALLQVPRSS